MIDGCLRPDTSVDALHDLSRNRKTEPRVFAEAMCGRALRIETVEHVFQVLGRNAWSCIFDGNMGRAARLRRTDTDDASVRTERQCVVDQVAEYLSDPLVAAQHFCIRRKVASEFELYAMRQFGEIVDL